MYIYIYIFTYLYISCLPRLWSYISKYVRGSGVPVCVSVYVPVGLDAGVSIVFPPALAAMSVALACLYASVSMCRLSLYDIMPCMHALVRVCVLGVSVRVPAVSNTPSEPATPNTPSAPATHQVFPSVSLLQLPDECPDPSLDIHTTRRYRAEAQVRSRTLGVQAF